MFLSKSKVSECKLGLFEYAQSISKLPSRSAYIANFINYLLYLFDPFPRGLGIDLKGSNTFLPLMLSMHINRLGLFSHLYGTLFICITICQDSWVGATALCMEVGWRCTIALSAWCITHQLSACEYTVMRSFTPLRCQNYVYISIYGHMQPYIHTFKCIYKF